MQRRSFVKNIFGAAIATRLPLPKSLPAPPPVNKPYSLLLNNLSAQSGSMYPAMLKKYGNENYAMTLEMLGRAAVPPASTFKHYEDAPLIDQKSDI